MCNASKGPPSETNLYLFNGDIVDKGPMSLECILYLFLLKLSKPDHVFINRYVPIVGASTVLEGKL